MQQRSLVLAALLLLCSAPICVAAGTTMHWTIDGVQRDAIVFLPSKPSAHPPLLIAFHGHGGKAAGTAKLMRFQNEWPEAIVVYPQGLPTVSQVDPAGRNPGWQREAGTDNDRDLKLFDAIVATMVNDHHADEHRVFAVGFSNGAFFTYLLWSARASAINSVGICAAKIVVPLTTARAVIHIAGQKDPLVPIADQMASMDQERQVDGCTLPPKPCGAGCKFYPSTTQTPEVAIIHPGGHVYPPWATPRIVEFFIKHGAH